MTVGSCLCGAVEIKYDASPMNFSICHCLDCQKWSGSTCTTNVMIPADALSVTKGAPKTFNNKGLSGAEVTRSFCSDCGSSLFSQADMMKGLVIVKGGVLDDGASEFPVQAELFTKDRRRCMTAVPDVLQIEAQSYEGV